MPVRKIKDKSGDTMTLLDINNSYFPVLRNPTCDQEEEIISMSGWEAREDDILICAYPKSGTHWIWEVACMLLKRNPNRIPRMKESAMLEGCSREQFNNFISPRILNTHMLFEKLPESFVKKRCKQIYIVRNPKDIAVSFYNHHTSLLDYEYNGAWSNYLYRFMEGLVDYGSWCDYVLHWEKEMNHHSDIPIHVLSYEDMKKNDVHEIKRLAKFLNIEVDELLVRDIASECSFKKMKKEKDPLEDPLEWKDKLPGMYRKGEVGDWKNWFTVSQSEQFDSMCQRKLGESNVLKMCCL